jgi:hypothetical protein
MDYFSELLESYSKLKKRTYKITYINENVTDRSDVNPETLKRAEEQAQSLISNPYKSFADALAAAGDGGTFAYKKANSDDVSVAISGNKRLGGTAAPGGVLDTTSKAYNNLVGHFIKELGEGQEEMTEQQKNLTVAGSLEGTALEGLSEYVETGIKQYLVGLSNDGVINIKEGIINTLIVKGNPAIKEDGTLKSSPGILGKILEANVRVVDDDGLSEASTEPMGASMARSVLDNFKAVASFPAVPEEYKQEACQDILKKVGFYKNNLILFGATPKELLVIGDKNKQNQLMKIGLDSIKDRCGYDDDSFTRVAGSQFSMQEKNDAKGVFFEAVHVAALQIVQGDYDSARETLKKAAARSQKVLESIKRERGDKGLGFEEAWEKIVQDEILEAFSSEEKLKGYLVDELSLALPFAKYMDADEVRGVGLAVATGGREDIEYVYNDELKALEKAEELGADVIEKDGQYIIGVGLKRLQKIAKAKFGEVNSISRMLTLMDFFTPEDANDRNQDPEFKEYITQNLYEGNEGRQAQAITYAQGLESEIGAVAAGFLEDKVYSSNNKIKKVSADKAAKSLFDSIKRKLNYSELKLSAFQNTLFTTAEGQAKMKDFSSSTDEGEENRYRLAELVSRVARKKRLQADLASGNRAAEDYVMNMAYITGANSRNMTQLISDDEGRVLAVKHNDILNYINQSSDRTIEYAQDGTTIVISGGGSTVYLKQERTDGGGNTSKTRTYLEVPKLTLEQFAVEKDFSPSRRTTEDIRKLFIQGQIKLLEDLLSQTNDNPLL